MDDAHGKPLAQYAELLARIKKAEQRQKGDGLVTGNVHLRMIGSFLEDRAVHHALGPEKYGNLLTKRGRRQLRLSFVAAGPREVARRWLREEVGLDDADVTWLTKFVDDASDTAAHRDALTLRPSLVRDLPDRSFPLAEDKDSHDRAERMAQRFIARFLPAAASSASVLGASSDASSAGAAFTAAGGAESRTRSFASTPSASGLAAAAGGASVGSSRLRRATHCVASSAAAGAASAPPAPMAARDGVAFSCSPLYTGRKRPASEHDGGHGAHSHCPATSSSASSPGSRGAGAEPERHAKRFKSKH
jgi:8-oxo-dGTP pyrophosphatase MutT (NUDIX family)